MNLNWTDIQRNRLVELDADATTLARTFDDADQRNRAFQRLEKERVAAHRRHLDDLRNGPRRPRLCRLETTLVETLVSHGFVQVATPVLMSLGLLGKMSITADHPPVPTGLLGGQGQMPASHAGAPPLLCDQGPVTMQSPFDMTRSTNCE